MVTAVQKNSVRNIGTGTVGSYPVFRGPEKLACQDMSFGRPRKCNCFASCQARRVQEAAVVKFGNRMPYQFFTRHSPKPKQQTA